MKSDWLPTPCRRHLANWLADPRIRMLDRSGPCDPPSQTLVRQGCSRRVPWAPTIKTVFETNWAQYRLQFASEMTAAYEKLSRQREKRRDARWNPMRAADDDSHPGRNGDRQKQNPIPTPAQNPSSFCKAEAFRAVARERHLAHAVRGRMACALRRGARVVACGVRVLASSRGARRGARAPGAWSGTSPRPRRSSRRRSGSRARSGSGTARPRRQASDRRSGRRGRTSRPLPPTRSSERDTTSPCAADAPAIRAP